MQSQMGMFNNQKKMPDFSEMLSNYFGGSENKRKKPGDKAVAKRAGKRR